MTAGAVRRPDVTVIGAGVIGLAVAVQLRRAGTSEVLVVDRAPTAGSGSTARANGGVRAQFTTAVNVRFSRFTIGELTRLDVVTAGLVGLHRIGYLFLAGTEEGSAMLRDAHRLQRGLGVDVDLISAEQAQALAPMLDTRGVRTATFCADDGVVDPNGVVAALLAECRRLEVTLLFDAEVLALERRRSRTLVTTAAGTLETDRVVNAAGPFAREVAALAGVDLPVTPRRRNLVCTEPVDTGGGTMPMCVDLDTGLLVRREGGGGLLVAWSDPNEPPGFDTRFDESFLERVAERAGKRFPFLALAGINARKCWAGLYPETADHHAIIDTNSGAPWFVQCAGFGGHGIMHSLAAGQAVAELVERGRCDTFDLRPLALGRFEGAVQVVERAVL
jgi:sarcosine oxidase subunit beta